MTVPMPAPATATAYALDETAKRRNKLPATMKDGAVVVQLDVARSPWIELVAESPA